MRKWTAMLLAGCVLLGVNAYLLYRVHSLEQKAEVAEERIQQLRNSTQRAVDTLSSSVSANDGDLRRKLDFRFGQVDEKVRQLQGRVALLDGLEYWSSLGNVRKVRLELQRGVDVNERGENGYTPLHAAAENGHAEVVRLLLGRGADKTAQLDSGETALALARAGKHAAIVQLLEGK
jgi:hypothetical protein